MKPFYNHINIAVTLKLLKAFFEAGVRRVITVMVNDFTALLSGITGSSYKVVYSDKQKGDAEHTLADITLAKHIIGYNPEISIKDGLLKFVDWYKLRERI